MSRALRVAALRRAMQVADLTQVLELEVRAYSHPWSRGNFIDSIAAGYLAEVWHGAGTAQQLLGYFVAMAGVDEVHLLNLTVAPAWHGQGIGSALLEAVAERAGERGLATMWLEVRASNARARALYARRGFVEAGLRRGYYPAAGGREDAIVMRRALTGAPAAQGSAHVLD